jgi:hypothetical protein
MGETCEQKRDVFNKIESHSDPVANVNCGTLTCRHHMLAINVLISCFFTNHFNILTSFAIRPAKYFSIQFTEVLYELSMCSTCPVYLTIPDLNILIIFSAEHNKTAFQFQKSLTK